MKIIIIGAVAAGTSAAAKARRNDEDAVIKIYEMDSYISYSGCGMPYYLGGVVEDSESLNPRDPEFFKKKYDVDVHIHHKVLKINPDDKTVLVKNLDSGEEFIDSFDKLIISTGAKAFMPPIEGADLNHVFTLRNFTDMFKIKKFIDDEKPKTAVLIGSGPIGLEVCENLTNIGIKPTIIEMLPQVYPALDEELAKIVEDHLIEKNVHIITNDGVTKINEDSVELKSGSIVNADLVLVSAGIRPETSLATDAGIELGAGKSIKVDEKMKTNIKDIFACGDCAENYNTITKEPTYIPLGTTANKMGRVAGDAATGGKLEYLGTIGTGIVKVFDLTVAMSGLSEKNASDLGIEFKIVRHESLDKPVYFDGTKISVKAIIRKDNNKIIGVQLVGKDGVDKRIDVYATAITLGANIDQLAGLDLSYSPPYSTTRDPVLYTGMIYQGIKDN